MLGLKGLSFDLKKIDMYTEQVFVNIQPLHVKFFFIHLFRKSHIPGDTRVVVKKCQF